jgi:hypothetical protein
VPSRGRGPGSNPRDPTIAATLVGVVWLIALAAFFGLFVWMVWRMSAGPSNQRPGNGNNLPWPSNVAGQWGPFARMGGAPEPGTRESLEHSDPVTARRRAEHRDDGDGNRN